MTINENEKKLKKAVLNATKVFNENEKKLNELKSKYEICQKGLNIIRNKNALLINKLESKLFNKNNELKAQEKIFKNVTSNKNFYQKNYWKLMREASTIEQKNDPKEIGKANVLMASFALISPIGAIGTKLVHNHIVNKRDKRLKSIIGSGSIKSPMPGSELYNAYWAWKRYEKNMWEPQKNKVDELKKEKNDLENKLNALKTEVNNKNDECKKINEEIEKIDIGFNKDDINEIEHVLNSEKLSASKYNLGLKRAKISGNNDLFDMRNLNGKNFRSNVSIINALNTGYKNLPEDGTSSDKTSNSAPKISPSKSYYMNVDYLFSNSFDSPGKQRNLGKLNFKSMPEIQRIIINEFQPYDMLSIADLLPKLANTVGNVAQGISNSIGGFIVNTARNSIMNTQIDEVSKDPSKAFSYLGKSWEGRQRKFFTSDPVQQVHNMFNGGKWLNTYEIPFYGNDYLKSDYKGSWSWGGASESLGGISVITNMAGSDFPSNPKFKVSMANSANRNVKSEFYLINANDQWLFRNFQFIQAIFAGTSWMHLKYCIVRPTNVYNVICPGRFHMIWASMGCSIEFCGKLRKNKNVSDKISKLGIHSIDNDMLWPDAWKITLDIKDFTPNNFNMYADYYINGYNPDEIVNLDYKINMIEAFSDLTKYVGEMKESIIGTAKAQTDLLVKEGKKVIDDMMGNDKSKGKLIDIESTAYLDELKKEEAEKEKRKNKETEKNNSTNFNK